MYSLSIDYIFNRVYDILLGIKYFWMFTLLRTSPEKYIADISGREWDGLRDRGWFNDYFAAKDALVPQVELHLSTWQEVMKFFGAEFPDTDGDGIPDVNDASPYDSQNLTQSELKERYEADYTVMDSIKDFFGIGPKDVDKDSVPDSYELAHGLDANNPDSDRDGASDGQELAQASDPLNNDTDSDGVLDGRDERPVDPEVSAFTIDSDGDGVSDLTERKIGSDELVIDTDGDGIPDGMDAYTIDPTNLSQIAEFDVDKATQGLHFSVQNPILSLFVDMLSVFAIFLVIGLVYSAFRWFLTFAAGLHMFEEHFSHGHGGHGGGHGDLHVITHHEAPGVAHTHHDTHDAHNPLGIPGLAVTDEFDVHGGGHPANPPEASQYDVNPRFAIIQGYFSSPSEALWRIGVMEADTMLEEVLRDKGYQGDTIADMLKSASFKTIDLAWDAHKLRNRIAHEGSSFELTEREAKRVFTLFETVFRELKAIS